MIAQRFKQSGINVVVGVGTGAVGWEQGLSDNQSTYIPHLVATNYSDFAGAVSAKGGNNPTYLKNAITATTGPLSAGLLERSRRSEMREHDREGVSFDGDRGPDRYSCRAPTTWVAAENTCQDFAMLVDIAKAAGKHLTARASRKPGILFATCRSQVWVRRSPSGRTGRMQSDRCTW